MTGLAPLVEINLDKPRYLRFDLNAMCEVERVTDRAFSELDGSLRTMRVLVWAGLLHDDPELTIEDVGSLIHIGHLQHVSDAVGKALDVAMPSSSPGDESPKNPSGSTGSGSGQSGDMISV